jgi:uncharacterized membrane protein
MRGPNRLSAIAAIVLCAVSFAVSAQAPTSYRLTLIFKRSFDPAHENDEFEVTGINDKGQVAGYRLDRPETTGGFIWRNGEFRIISPSSDVFIPRVWGINEWSEVAGDYSTLVPERSHGFFWRGGRFTPIEAAAGELSLRVIHLNNRRQVVVSSTNAQDVQYFVWRRGQVTRLEPLPGRDSRPERINDRGVVAGTASAGGGLSVPVVWQEGTAMALDLPLGTTSASTRDINDHNTVLVDASASQGSVTYLWDDGQYTALPVLPGRARTQSFALNNSGVAVGTTDRSLATAWYGQQPVDLNTMVRANDPLKPFVVLQIALVVNDRGEIVARGQDSRDFETGTGAISTYLLTPID